jgi:hypothetical protein
MILQRWRSLDPRSTVCPAGRGTRPRSIGHGHGTAHHAPLEQTFGSTSQLSAVLAQYFSFIYY